MPIPTNITAALAVELTLPSDGTQDAHFGGVTYDLWFKFTAPTDATLIGAFGYGEVATYSPVITVWTGATPTQILALSGTNVPIQFAVNGGTVYYLRIRPGITNGTPANLQLNVQSFTVANVPTGSIVINDDTSGYPLVLVDPITGEALGSVDGIPAGENGAILADGTMMFEDISVPGLKIYNDQLVEQVAIITNFTQPISSNKIDKFYVGDADTLVKTISKLGAIGGIVDLGTSSLAAMAPSIDESILYYTSAPLIGGAVKRWDLISDVALSDLAAGVASHYICHDILVLDNGTIIVAFQKATATMDLVIHQYQPDGTIIGTYNYGSDLSSLTARLAYALDDPTSFWVWVHTASPNSFSRFIHIETAGFTALAITDSVIFNKGAYNGPVSATPSTRFGHSASCPFLLSRTPLILLEPEPEPPAVVNLNGGIYQMVIGKTNDTLYIDVEEETTEDVKIPDPFIKTGMLGN